MGKPWEGMGDDRREVSEEGLAVASSITDVTVSSMVGTSVVPPS